MNGSNELHGRVAVVTGAGRNIGRAIALELAAGGAAVVVNTRANMGEAEAVANEIEKSGGSALPVTGDVADAPAGDAMGDAPGKKIPGIDHLGDKARPRGGEPGAGQTHPGRGKGVDVTLDGAFFCVKACLPYMKKSGAGAIVNMGGLSSHTGSKNRIHVVTAKSGLVGLTRALAHDLAEDNVTVNCVAPGLVATVREKGFVEPQHHAIHHTLSGKRGAPADIAHVVRFLGGPGARYVTGQVIHANGGAFIQ